MSAEIPYGRSKIYVNIPQGNEVEVLKPHRGHDGLDTGYVDRVLENFVNENLRRLQKGSLCVLVSDKTRAAFNHIIVPRLLSRVVDAGFDRENVKILVANGLHTPMTRKELAENLGEKVLEEFEVINHVSDGPGHVYLGRTSFGTEVYINKVFVSSEVKIATGLVEPHFFAGYSGGYKSVLPGVSATRTVYMNHGFKMLSNRNARAGVLKGNPVHEDIWEAGKMAGLDFAINVTVSDGKLDGIFAGKVEEAYDRAVEKVAAESTVKVSRLYDVVITSNGGYPLDRNLYQAVKGMSVGEEIVKRNGYIIIASECEDGVVHEDFRRLMEIGDSADEILNYIKANEPLRDQWQAQILARILLKANVIVVCKSLPEKLLTRMKLMKADDVKEALEIAGVKEGSGKSLAIIPDGPYTIPVINTFDVSA